MSNAPGSKKRIKTVRAFPIDANGNKLKDAKPLYRNGVWADQELTTLTDQQQKDFHNRIQIATKNFAKTTNAHVPSWAASAGSNTYTPLNAASPQTGQASGIAPGLQGAKPNFNPVQAVGNLWNAFSDPFGSIAQFNSGSAVFDLNSDKDILGGGVSGISYMRYPQNINLSMDTLKMTCFRYRPPYGQAFGTLTPGQTGTGSIGNIKRNSPFKERIGTIELPMPGQIVDSTSAGWEVDYMNDINMAAAQHLGAHAAGYGGVMAGGAVASLIPGLGALGNATQGASKLTLYGALLGSSGKAGSTAISANLVSMLGSQLGFDISADQILSRGGGIVSNSNAELLFRGVNLRTFQMMYRMVARSPEETRKITQIIRAFKQWSAPRKLTADGTAQAGDASFFLGTPNIFQLVYMTTDATGQRVANTHVHKFKPCALTNFSVNYAPGEQWMSYEQGAPVAFNLNFQFSELEPIYNTDFTDNIPADRKANPAGDTGTGDLMPIGLYDVGY